MEGNTVAVWAGMPNWQKLLRSTDLGLCYQKNRFGTKRIPRKILVKDLCKCFAPHDFCKISRRRFFSEFVALDAAVLYANPILSARLQEAKDPSWFDKGWVFWGFIFLDTDFILAFSFRHSINRVKSNVCEMLRFLRSMFILILKYADIKS